MRPETQECYMQGRQFWTVLQLGDMDLRGNRVSDIV
jgi:hypothetical protein